MHRRQVHDTHFLTPSCGRQHGMAVHIALPLTASQDPTVCTKNHAAVIPGANTDLCSVSVCTWPTPAGAWQRHQRRACTVSPAASQGIAFIHRECSTPAQALLAKLAMHQNIIASHVHLYTVLLGFRWCCHPQQRLPDMLWWQLLPPTPHHSQDHTAAVPHPAPHATTGAAPRQSRKEGPRMAAACNSAAGWDRRLQQACPQAWRWLRLLPLQWSCWAAHYCLQRGHQAGEACHRCPPLTQPQLTALLY